MIDNTADLICYGAMDIERTAEERTAEERQRLVGGLQTDPQETLDDKKAELKVGTPYYSRALIKDTRTVV